jgi:asparagine synthetase B (glutamine-hydrolysing)
MTHAPGAHPAPARPASEAPAAPAAEPRAERYARLLEVFPYELRRRLLADDVPVRPTREILGAPGPGLAGLQRLDLDTYLPGDLLPKADLASMAASLELRAPLLDHRVVELGLALPDELKVRGRTGKLALREAFADLLPPRVAARGKTGFGVPLGRWFRTDLSQIANDVLLDNGRGLFRRDEVERLLREHRDGRADHGHRLWCLLTLELWQRTYVDSNQPALQPSA